MNRVIAAIDSIPATDESTARTAGRLLRAAASDQTIDALVVSAAIHAGGGRILTSDPDDLRLLASGTTGITVHRAIQARECQPTKHRPGAR